MNYRSKTIAAWLALVAGAVGAHRFYLHGPRDLLGWACLPPTLAGAAGVLRMRALGQDDHVAWALIPLLGLTLSLGALAAIVIALTPDDAWAARRNPGQAVVPTAWGAVLAAIAALFLGGIVLMGTIAFSMEKFFEWQLAPPAAVRTTSG
jgi:hypothetical protein